jgi:hypothetical protein
MRRTLLALAVVATVGSAAAWAQKNAAKSEAPETKTVEGILVDMKCYSMDTANWVQDHMTPKGKMPMCAMTCAKMGIPVGVLEGGKPGGMVYVLITPSMPLGDHMTKTTRVTGTLALDGHGIVPDKIEVKNKDKWQEVKIATMM